MPPPPGRRAARSMRRVRRAWMCARCDRRISFARRPLSWGTGGRRQRKNGDVKKTRGGWRTCGTECLVHGRPVKGFLLTFGTTLATRPTVSGREKGEGAHSFVELRVGVRGLHHLHHQPPTPGPNGTKDGGAGCWNFRGVCLHWWVVYRSRENLFVPLIDEDDETPNQEIARQGNIF